jgi:hypothetical protein
MVSVTSVQKALKGADYPASKDDLVQLAQRNGADDDVIDLVRGLEGGRFDGPDTVMSALGGKLGGAV